MQLENYLWETSDILVPGKAILILPLGLLATNVVVGNENFKKLNKQYENKEVWYGTKPSEYYIKQNIKVTVNAEYTANTGGVIPVNTDGSETVHNPTYANGNRAHFRFSKPGVSYGNNIQVFFDNVLTASISSGGSRYERSDGFLWKPVSDNNGKLVILGPFNKKNSSCTIKY